MDAISICMMCLPAPMSQQPLVRAVVPRRVPQDYAGVCETQFNLRRIVAGPCTVTAPAKETVWQLTTDRREKTTALDLPGLRFKQPGKLTAMRCPRAKSPVLGNDAARSRGDRVQVSDVRTATGSPLRPSTADRQRRSAPVLRFFQWVDIGGHHAVEQSATSPAERLRGSSASPCR